MAVIPIGARRSAARIARYLVVLAALTACDAGPLEELIFLDGRAVALGSDSLFAMTRSGFGGVLLRHRVTGVLDTLGVGELESPQHVQWSGGRWFVSDVRNGQARIVVFTAAGAVERHMVLDSQVSAPHQFAVLPDGRVIVEAPDGRLLALSGDSVSTFALTPRSGRTGLLVAGRGGAMHAVPDRAITLYNARGNIRWRLDWPWNSAAFVADLAVDSQGRPHVLAGQEGRPGFIVFGLLPETGEVGRWSEAGPFATFVVRPLGDIMPDSASRWVPDVEP